MVRVVGLWMFVTCASLCVASSSNWDARVTQDFNFGWKFSRGDSPEATLPAFDDSAWRDIRLPHDWSVEESFTQEETAGATAFLPGGIGWYRKRFTLPQEAQGKVTWIEFDGVYNNAKVWINGHPLGQRPYGYIPFRYDLTGHLTYGDKPNVLAVRADRSAFVDCRWYPGSGIYRKVKLVTTHPIHVPQWGSYVTTPVAEADQAEVMVRTTVKNSSPLPAKVSVELRLVDADHRCVGENSKETRLLAGETRDVEQLILVTKPKLWDTNNPHLYVVATEIKQDGQVLDRCQTTFGIRSLVYDAQKGFFLNGKQRLFKGVCLHHDGGLVGAAVPDGVWVRRLKALKEAGCNAIRTAHNPPSEAFLDLCDRMGFLVQDEAFDEWDNPKDKRNNYNQQKAEKVTAGYTRYFEKWAEADIKSMVLRDRNHPCIVMWSLGNEIEWTYPRYGQSTGYWEKKNKVNYYDDEPPYDVETIKKNFYARDFGKRDLADTAGNLARWVREIDTTRPVTANLVIPSVSSFSGYTDALDVIGYSYRQSVYDYGHRHYPDKMIIGTENWTQWHEWKPVIEKSYIHGIFLWTGIAYLGESGRWPSKGSNSGLLDFAGFKKPSWHMFRTLWNDEPHVYITTKELEKSIYKWDEEQQQIIEKTPGAWKRRHWGWYPVNSHWNYQKDEPVVVEVYTNCPEVELFVNGLSQGIHKLAHAEDRVLKWKTTYTAGTITAVGTKDGKRVDWQIKTSQQAAGIELTADKPIMASDFYDVVNITAQLVDQNGVPVTVEDRELVFDIQGDVRRLGVDNGSSTIDQDYQTNHCKTSQGRCLLVLQSKDKNGKVKVTATAGDITSQCLEIQIKD